VGQALGVGRCVDGLKRDPLVAGSQHLLFERGSLQQADHFLVPGSEGGNGKLGKEAFASGRLGIDHDLFFS
jgi:hypothetical protein